jgi:hypothetical protein
MMNIQQLERNKKNRTAQMEGNDCQTNLECYSFKSKQQRFLILESIYHKHPNLIKCLHKIFSFEILNNGIIFLSVDTREVFKNNSWTADVSQMIECLLDSCSTTWSISPSHIQCLLNKHKAICSSPNAKHRYLDTYIN